MQEKAKNVVIEIILSSATGRNRLQGVFDFLRGRADWNIRLPQTRKEFEQAVGERVDGIITSRVYSSELLRRLETGPVPVVFMDIDRQDRRQRRAIDITVANDNGGVGLAAARYLLSLGRFRSYGYVPFSAPTRWSLRRGQAFAAMMRKAGERVSVFIPEQSELSGWIRELPKPAALFCACDAVSRRVVEACRVARVRIPSQAVVLGVDNDELICQISRPELSSVRLDTQGEGFEAAKALHALMKGGGRSRTILMKPLGIVERTSTNPPPPAAHLVQTALEFIAQNAVKGISADDVARHMHCSRRLLDLRFAKYHGESAHAAIVRTRLAAVRRELLHSNRKLLLIARECGFRNAAVLKNLFRKTYGLSMRDYRKSRGLRK
ncbi:MAG: substrate-binding domain-containing protein [Kiritimatiellia bacterium]